MRTDAVRIALILTLSLSSVLHLTLSRSLASAGYCSRRVCLYIFFGSPGVSQAFPGFSWALEALAGSRMLSPGSPGPSWALLGSIGLLAGPLGRSWALRGRRGHEGAKSFCFEIWKYF